MTVRNGLTLVGPYALVQGGIGLIIRNPIFKEGVDRNETFGMGRDVYDCPDELCYDADARRKFW